MARQEFSHTVPGAVNADGLRLLFERLDGERRPFELVVHRPGGATGTRGITVKTRSGEDAEYFRGVLEKLSPETSDSLTHGTD